MTDSVCIRSVMAVLAFGTIKLKVFVYKYLPIILALHPNSMTSPDHLVLSIHVNPEKFIISRRHKTSYIYVFL